MRETPTLGIRVRPVQRQIAYRETVPFHSQYGVVAVKVKYLDERPVSVAPEYEDCRRLALELGVPLQDIQQQILTEASARMIERP